MGGGKDFLGVTICCGYNLLGVNLFGGQKKLVLRVKKMKESTILGSPNKFRGKHFQGSLIFRGHHFFGH